MENSKQWMPHIILTEVTQWKYPVLLVSCDVHFLHKSKSELFRDSLEEMFSFQVLEAIAEYNFSVYGVPNMYNYYRVCRTNLPSNTAFRGFGVPQGLFVWQEIIEHIAHKLGLVPAQVSGTKTEAMSVNIFYPYPYLVFISIVC